MADACTGLTARWCAVHGDCTCPRDEAHLDSQRCPLHGPESDHAADDPITNDPLLWWGPPSGGPQSGAVRIDSGKCGVCGHSRCGYEPHRQASER